MKGAVVKGGAIRRGRPSARTWGLLATGALISAVAGALSAPMPLPQLLGVGPVDAAMPGRLAGSAASAVAVASGAAQADGPEHDPLRLRDRRGGPLSGLDPFDPVPPVATTASAAPTPRVTVERPTTRPAVAAAITPTLPANSPAGPTARAAFRWIGILSEGGESLALIPTEDGVRAAGGGSRVDGGFTIESVGLDSVRVTDGATKRLEEHRVEQP